MPADPHVSNEHGAASVDGDVEYIVLMVWKICSSRRGKDDTSNTRTYQRVVADTIYVGEVVILTLSAEKAGWSWTGLDGAGRGWTGLDGAGQDSAFSVPLYHHSSQQLPR